MASLLLLIATLLLPLVEPPSPPSPPPLGRHEGRKAILREGILFTDCRVLTEAEFPVHPLWSVEVTKGEPERLTQGFVCNYNQRYGVPTWGFIGSHFFVFPMQGPYPSILLAASRGPVDPYMEVYRAGMRGESPPREAREAMSRGGGKQLVLSPIREFTSRWEIQGCDPLFSDFACLTPRDGSVLFTYEGTLHHHRFDDDAERWQEIWTKIDSVPTTITGAFRAMRSGDRLVLVDERGAVYSTPREGHVLIGRITNWPTEEQAGTRAVYLLEDAATHHLRVLEVIDDPEDPEKKKVIALSFDLEDGREDSPFHAEMPSEDVQRALIRLTEAIDESGK